MSGIMKCPNSTAFNFLNKKHNFTVTKLFNFRSFAVKRFDFNDTLDDAVEEDDEDYDIIG